MKNNTLKPEESHLYPVFHRIPVEVYEPLSLWLAFCASDKDVNNTFTDTEGDKIPPMKDTERATTRTVETLHGGWHGVLIRFDDLESMNDTATVTHESVHAAMFFFNLIGSQLIDTADHEPFAYLAGFTARKIHETYLWLSQLKQSGELQKQAEPNSKGEQKTCCTTYKLTRREQEGKESKQCPHVRFNIGSEYCRTCRYFVSHDHVYRTVKCSYPNPVPDIFLEHFKNNKKIMPFTDCPNCGKETPAKSHEKAEINYGMDVYYIANMQHQEDISKKTKKQTIKTRTMKEIKVINGNIVREGSNFFKAVQCRPRNPKARCENCAFDDCSNLEFSDPVFCNARERLDNTNIVWRPLTSEETLNEIQKRKNSVADYQQLLESAKKAGKEAKYADDIVRYAKIIKDIKRNINFYKSELEKME